MSALLINDGQMMFGTQPLEGQVLIPVITQINWKAATKKVQEPQVALTVNIPRALCPTPDDVSWLQFITPTGSGKVRAMYVVLEFEPDTLSERQADYEYVKEAGKRDAAARKRRRA